MNKHKSLFLALLLTVFTSTSFAQEVTFGQQSYAKAREVLLAGIEALGGLEKIDSVGNMVVSYKEFASSRGQNISPGAPDFLDEGNEARYVYDAGEGFIRHERNLPRRGRLFNPVFVFRGRQGFFYWPQTKELHNSINVDLIKSLFNFRFAYPPRLLPHLIVQTASKHRTNLRWVGETLFEGSPHDVIVFSDSDGTLMTLYFNRDTGLLTKTEELMDDLLAGDAVGEVIYPKYRDVDGLKFPDEILFTVGGKVTQRMMTLTVQLNVNSDKSLFEPPEGVEPSQYPQPFVPQELASGVYFVPLFNGIGFPYNSMFVVFDDYVLVLDAPLSDLLSEFYIGLIKRVAPGKAIKYVVPTHHHSDHIGGIKRFVGEGATVVTTPGNKLFFEEVVQAPRTLRPTQRVLKEKLAFEIFEDSKVFRDDNHEVPLYDVGPNPHANEIVVAYLPKQKILYVTDMLWIHLADHYPPPRKTLVAFAKKIEELGLEIETIAPGHGKVGTAEDLHKALGVDTAFRY